LGKLARADEPLAATRGDGPVAAAEAAVVATGDQFLFGRFDRAGDLQLR
jgi:hypothetical protein